MREKILEDLKSAMKKQDKVELSVIRMVKSSMQMQELKIKRKLNDNQVINIITKEIKTRKESIKEFEKGNREDLIKQTEEEIKILERYLPEQLSIEEVKKLIDEIFDKVKPESIKDMGKIMKEITPKVNGKFDIARVSEMIKEKLK